MASKADFSEEEWETVLEGPPSAGLIVSMSQKGGTFRETFSIGKAYAEAKRKPGASQLMDEILASKPKVDRERAGSQEEFRQHHLDLIREAVSLLETKASSDELFGYRQFVISVAERVAGAKEEGDQPVSEAEQAAIDEITQALGA